MNNDQETARQLRDFLTSDPDEAIGMATGMNADGTVNVRNERGESVNAIAATPCTSQTTLLQCVNGQWYAFQSPNKTASESTLIYKRSRPQEKSKSGKIKFLFAKLNGDHWDLYIGGDRKNPTKIAEATYYDSIHPSRAEGLTFSYIVNTGGSSNKWIVGFQEQRAEYIPIEQVIGINFEENWEKRRYLRTIHGGSSFEVEDKSFYSSPLRANSFTYLRKNSLWLGSGIWLTDLLSSTNTTSNLSRFINSQVGENTITGTDIYLCYKGNKFATRYQVTLFTNDTKGHSNSKGLFFPPTEKSSLIETPIFFNTYLSLNTNQLSSRIQIPELNIDETVLSSHWLGNSYGWYKSAFFPYMVNNELNKGIMIKQNYGNSEDPFDLTMNKVAYLYNRTTNKYDTLDLSALAIDEPFRQFINNDLFRPSGSSRQVMSFVGNKIYSIEEPSIYRQRKQPFVRDINTEQSFRRVTANTLEQETAPIDKDKTLKVKTLTIQESEGEATISVTNTQEFDVFSLKIAPTEEYLLLAMSFHPN